MMTNEHESDSKASYSDAKLSQKNLPFDHLMFGDPNDVNESSCATPSFRRPNDFDRFVGHEDFGRFLVIASKVKALRHSLVSGKPIPNNDHIMSLNHKNTREAHEQMSETTRFIRSNVLTKEENETGTEELRLDSIPRGTFSQTDSMMDEAIERLTIELKRCLAWKSVMGKKSNTHSPPSIQSKPTKGPSPKRKKICSPEGSNGGSGDAIAVKYSKWQTDILNAWMIDNISHPFPDSSQIKELGKATNLTYAQVVNWSTNVRKRNLKASVEGGKKPHHFLDFLFLANDREKRANEERSGETTGIPGSRGCKTKRTSRPNNAKKTRRPKSPPGEKSTVNSLRDQTQQQCYDNITSSRFGFGQSADNYLVNPMTAQEHRAPPYFQQHYNHAIPANLNFNHRYCPAHPGQYAAPPPYFASQHFESRQPFLNPNLQQNVLSSPKEDNEVLEALMRSVGSPKDERTISSKIRKTPIASPDSGSVETVTTEMYSNKSATELTGNSLSDVSDDNVIKLDCLMNPDEFWQNGVLESEPSSPSQSRHHNHFDNYDPIKRETILEYAHGGLVSTPKRNEEENKFWEEYAPDSKIDCDIFSFDTLSDTEQNPETTRIPNNHEFPGQSDSMKVSDNVNSKNEAKKKFSLTDFDVTGLLETDFARIREEDLIQDFLDLTALTHVPV